MSIQVDRLALKDALKLVQVGAPRRERVVPVALDTDGDLLSVTARHAPDDETVVTIPTYGVDAPLHLECDARLLAATVVSGSDVVRLTVDGRLCVSPDDAVTFALHSWSPGTMLPARREPGSQVVASFDLEPDQLAVAVAVASAASGDMNRPVLTCVGIGSGGRWAATDSYRMLWATIDGTAAADGTLLPVALLDDLAAWHDTDPVRFVVDDDTLVVTGVARRGPQRARRLLQVTRTRALVDGTFPTVDKLIPTDHDGTITVDRDLLTDRLAMATRCQRHIDAQRVATDGTTLTVDTAGDGDAAFHAALPVKDHTGEPLTIGVNGTLLRRTVDAVGTASEDPTVTLHHRGGLKPLVIDAGGPVTGLLMPMRLD